MNPVAHSHPIAIVIAIGFVIAAAAVLAIGVAGSTVMDLDQMRSDAVLRT